MTRRNKGFTLIELLVVISIIALLIGILLPALGEAKRKAQQLQDVANLGEHGKAIGIFSAQNRGRMPNIGPGNNVVDGTGTGSSSLPAITWANRDAAAAQNEGPSGGSPYAWNGFAFSGGGLSYDDVWRFHNLAFGDYIIDGEGFELLADVFASPRSETGANFQTIKSGSNPNLSFPENFQADNAGSSGTGGPGKFQAARYQTNGDDQYLWALQSDYKYTFAGLYGQNVGTSQASPSFWLPGQTIGGLGQGPGNSLPWNDSPTYTLWRSWVQTTAFDFPEDKVAFWEFFGSTSRVSNYYFMPNVECPIVTVGGSAKVVRPFDIMPDGHESSEAYRRGQGWGCQVHYNSQMTPHGTQGLGQALGLGTNSKPFAWFVYTDRGPRGRDLSGVSN